MRTRAVQFVRKFNGSMAKKKDRLNRSHFFA